MYILYHTLINKSSAKLSHPKSFLHCKIKNFFLDIEKKMCNTETLLKKGMFIWQKVKS